MPVVYVVYVKNPRDISIYFRRFRVIVLLPYFTRELFPFHAFAFCLHTFLSTDKSSNYGTPVLPTIKAFVPLRNCCSILTGSHLTHPNYSSPNLTVVKILNLSRYAATGF